MIFYNGKRAIATYGTSFLEINTNSNVKTHNEIFHICKSYNVNIGNLIITLEAYKAEKNCIRFRIICNSLGTVSFHDLEQFCIQENIHDFDVVFNTILKGKLLYLYTPDEQEFFIVNLGVDEGIFSIIDSVYVEYGEEFYFYTFCFLPFDEPIKELDQTTDYGMDYLIVPHTFHTYITEILANTTMISKYEYEEQIGNDFVYQCYDNHNCYYITILHFYVAIHVKGYYLLVEKKIFFEHYNPIIVQQLEEQITIYEKFRGTTDDYYEDDY